MSNQPNVSIVLSRLSDLAKSDNDYADMLSEQLEDFLNEVKALDGFGDEGQDDPRGDFRIKEWNMKEIQSK